MTLAAAILEAKKHGLRQNQDGAWTLTLNVHPNDMPSWLLTAPMGQRLAITVAALDETAVKQDNGAEAQLDEQSTSDRPVAGSSPAGPAKPATPWDRLAFSQQAGIRCNDPEFGDFMADRMKPSETIEDAVRRICGVTSRSDLATKAGAAGIWIQLDRDFEEYREWKRREDDYGYRRTE